MTSYNKIAKQALANKVKKHPELASLIPTNLDTFRFSREWMKRYVRSQASPEVKSLVVRTMLGDPKLEGTSFGIRELRLAVEYFCSHPLQPLSNALKGFANHHIPKHLAKVLGIPWNPPNTFFAEFGTIPYYEYLQGNIPSVYKNRKFGRQVTDFRCLAPLYESRLVTSAICHRLINNPVKKVQYHYFFDTGIESLDLRNILVFLRYFIESDPMGGRKQNKLPLIITDYLRTKRLSIPSLYPYLDIVSLALTGVIKIEDVSRKDDVYNIRYILKLIKQEHVVNDLEGAARYFDRLLLPTPRWCDDMMHRRKKNVSQQVYLTSFYFNLTRLLAFPNKAALFNSFVPYYRAVDTTSLRKTVVAYYSTIDRRYVAELSRLIRLHPDIFHGIRLRDLANCLYLVHRYADRMDDVRVRLPSVAKFSFGAKEPVHRGRKRPIKRQPKRKTPVKRSPPTMPLLDLLTQSEYK